MEWGDVVEDPERAPVGADHQICAFDDHVPDGRDRQVRLEPLPVDTVVERDQNAAFRSAVQETATIRIFTHDTREFVDRDAVGDARPRRAVILGAIQVRMQVVGLVASSRHVRGRRVVWGWFDDIDHRPLR